MGKQTPSLYSQDDPLALAMKPPALETDEERIARVHAEAEAKLISERIDAQLQQERDLLKRKRADVKLLLLGQAESGKSTLQKQFQLMYKPHSLDQERASWRAVIYFNVVRSISHILSTLESFDDGADIDDSTSVYSGRSPKPALSQTGSSAGRYDPRSPKTTLANLRRRLMPVVSTDGPLAERLNGGVHVSGSGKGGVYVRSGWQSRTIDSLSRGMRRNPEADALPQDPLLDQVAQLLEASKDDIKELWVHPTVRALMHKRRLKLDEWAEHFLKHINRVASTSYLPTTDDILHARIQTMGVAEHIFDVSIHGKSVSWHLYDVGGARGQRHSWIPYFDDANAIIFVAPVSAFDQYLEEDPRTNRIDDSLQLFTQICSNALLKNVHLVLFLNKTDLLKSKIDAGVKVQKYITSFGNRANTYEEVVQYFRAHFLQVHRRNNENRRVLYTHFTSVVDTKATQRIIGNVRDSIFRGYLQDAALV
ncbi:guanine nucleotide binding protein, alpha subunit [Cylindrobasidium torrendii FP15055 ss-10]|uniref:Guanine nucleotide binding protein, alpha subunit n=1 Tax=Cylindrobasidium torrendii FP15055 ss-10 TaxID=1314674 RepID=A0A0D7BHH7_9AGAR|nr:guanine nucleotide binding protein, alpha subunit [Cylindrobasidium torrendii FP15055 ss-10]